MIRVRQLFISPGHNYFGHHGLPEGEHEVIEVDEIACVAGRGIRGDRFFDHEPDYKGQVTLFAMETFLAMKAALSFPDRITVAATRRNVITDGVEISELIGCEFEVQGVRFAGVEECRPCYWMNRAFGHEGAEAWLAGRGGLRARILSDGVLRRDAFP